MFSKEFNDEKILKKFGIKCGKNCNIHNTAIVTHPENLILKSNIRIDAYTIIVNPKKITINNYVHIGSHVLLHAGAEQIILNDYSGISSGVKIFTHTDDYKGDEFYSCFNKSKKTGTKSKIVLNKYCLVGTNSVVVPKAYFSEGSTLGPLSFISKKLKPWSMYWGNPAREYSKRKKDFIKKIKVK